MKKILFILLFFGYYSHAQDVELIWSEEIPTKARSLTILGSNGSQFYTTHVDNDDQLKGRIFDRFMKLSNEKPINFNFDDDDKYNYDGAYFLNNSILHFILLQKSKKESYFFGASTDFQLNTSENVKVLSEVQDQKVEKFGLRSISPDSTKVLTYYELKTKKKEPSILIYKVFDAQLKEVLNEGAASLPIKSKNYYTEEIRVDNFGNVFVMAVVTKEKKEREKGMSNYFYKLIVFAKDKTVKEFDFEYPDNDISYVDIIAGENNTFFCTGFLNEISRGKKALVSNKMFFTAIDCNTLTLTDSKLLEVPGLYPDKIRKTEDYVPYKIRNIFKKKDGGYAIVAEQYKLVISSYTTSNGVIHTSYYYYYCDFVCVHVDSKYDVTSVTRIPKYQLNAENPSIISTFFNDQVYIVYEDEAKNLTANSDKELKRSSSTVFSSSKNNSLFLVRIDANGEMEKNIIYDYKDTKIKPNIQRSKEVKPGQILLNAFNRLGLLTIRL
uniref:hypothetical protein n=1 Tax=Flavobacterium sp. TaxID=239 RepID=UPI00404B6ADD